MLIIASIIILSYLVGSIPSSIIVTRMVKGVDIREHGSGNAGGTNVYRVLGWKYGLLVVALDALKGVIAVLFVSQLFLIGKSEVTFNSIYFEDYTIIKIIAGLTAIIGHIWSVFASFKGGKGIATAVGMLLTIATVDILIAIGVFVIVVYFSKYVSLGSVLGAATLPLALLIRENIFNVDIRGYHTLIWFLLGLFVLISFTHRKNIERLISGNENKIVFKKK